MKERRPGEIDYKSGTVFWPFRYNAELFVPHLPKQHGKSWIQAACEKEATTMQVTYNGFTGELVKLEKINLPPDINPAYNLSIFCNEKKVTHSFSCINLEDVKFMGGAVSFGG